MKSCNILQKYISLKTLTATEIRNGNIKIAEFLGWKIASDGKTLENYNKVRKTPYWFSYNMVAPIGEFNFHRSADWVFIALEKIDHTKGCYTELVEQSCYIYDIHKFNDNVDAIIIIDSPSKIEAAWFAIIEFIKYYENEIKDISANT